MKASYQAYDLIFKRPAGTSRGVLKKKETYIIKLEDKGKIAYGECALFRGLSSDDHPDFEAKLKDVCNRISYYAEHLDELRSWPAIVFGIESALMYLRSGFAFGNSQFAAGEKGIEINGLIWMGDPDYMIEQIQEKLDSGFRCLKMKIGAIDFENELNILKNIRSNFDADQLEIRVDANGAFSYNEAQEKLNLLARLELHSIEQPIKQGQIDQMAKLCSETPLPIALDEELIGVNAPDDKRPLLKIISPQYIILKPALVGGFKSSEEWIELAQDLEIGWWATSALESNIGLNAIAQWLSKMDVDMPQGLGTGQLFENNIESPLELKADHLFYNSNKNWDLSCLGLFK